MHSIEILGAINGVAVFTAGLDDPMNAGGGTRACRRGNCRDAIAA